ncbi:MAG TPA: hypothetical protein VN842_06305 [Thermoplasmata archaeon]|nr:hypothetical protein [Thermoplasmata archaeon]
MPLSPAGPATPATRPFSSAMCVIVRFPPFTVNSRVVDCPSNATANPLPLIVTEMVEPIVIAVENGILGQLTP